MKLTFSLSFMKLDLATLHLFQAFYSSNFTAWNVFSLWHCFFWLERWKFSFWVSKHKFLLLDMLSLCHTSKLCVVDSSAKFYSLMGTFACGLFNLSSSNRLLVNIWAKFFSPMGPLPVAFLILVLPMDCWKYLDLLILVLFESSFYTTGTSHVSLVMDREWLPPLEQ